MKRTKSVKGLRPTTGKVREAVFDILRNRIGGARFLDLYAGTGAVGFDALKGGASEVVFVEESRRCSGQIEDMIRKSGFRERARVVTKKALSFIEYADLQKLGFDIIFLDPPYHTDEIDLVLKAIDSSTVLKDKGLVMAEHFKKKELPEKLHRLHKTRDYKYGDSVLTIFEIGDR